jgi:hypothetical protein
MGYTDIPTWMGILSFIVAIGTVYVLAKRDSRRVQRRKGNFCLPAVVRQQRTLLPRACIDTD